MAMKRGRNRAFLSIWGWRVLGGLSLMLAAIGVVLPLLPTTPLVILAAFCFAKSAPRLHAWLLANKTFGPMIREWQDKGAIAPRHKAMAVGMMAAAFAAALAFGAPLAALVVQVLCMGGAAVFVLTRPNA